MAVAVRRSTTPITTTLLWSRRGPSLRRWVLLAALGVALAALQRPAPALAATLPSGFTETQVATGLSSPTAMAFAPDGRLFVAQQGGQLRVIKNGALLATPFLSVTVSSSGERGLLGVAFDPNFTTNQYVYIYYTATTPAIHNRISRFTASGDVAAPGSELVIMDLENLSSATNHNGGALHFGTDGKLYVAVGENATSANSQTLNNRLGKMLRINADASIPTDNPFFSQASGDNRAIWALGLRNPFSFAVQPGTGRIFINDVGQSTWEEINDGIAGSNYGWPNVEGDGTPNPPITIGTYRGPLYVYANDASTCAITGGAFYNPQTAQFPSEYLGTYFFADYCGGWIRRYDPATDTVSGFATGIASPLDLQVSADGSLYYLARGAGAVFRVQYTASQAPALTQQPQSQTVAAGQSVTFSCAASGTAPLGYQWQRNAVNIAGATGTSYTIAAVTTADNGARFRCVVSNTFGSATSNEATLTVTSNQAPTGTITAPAAGTFYAAGDTIAYSGTGTDPEDGTLPASAFTWVVDFHHDTHFHPFVPETSGVTGGSFTIPTSGETDANVWYRIHLTVRDSGGLEHSGFRDVRPRTVTLTLASTPAGRGLTLDGQPVTAPFSVTSVAGITRSIGAPSPQSAGGTTYTFSAWSDGGAATHTISTPATNTTYTATFSVSDPAPVISGIRVTGVSRTRATVSWTTNEPADSQVEFRPAGATTWLASTRDPALVTGHSIRLEGLQAGTTYEYRVLSRDGADNLATPATGTFRTNGR